MADYIDAVRTLAMRAQAASRRLAGAGIAEKEALLNELAEGLRAGKAAILAANARDLQIAHESGMKESLLDRLMLNEKRVEAMADALQYAAQLPDPVGESPEAWVRPNGLRIQKRRVPLGVVGVIYEARPNVTADAIGLCLKSGNAVLLRGGKEAILSNKAIVAAMAEGVARNPLAEDAFLLVEDTDRRSALAMMEMAGLIDVLIPRGGAGLIRSVIEHSRVPVIETGTGNCHVYVEKTADFAMARRIIFNAKVSRPSVCNAAETLLVDSMIAEAFLPECTAELEAAGVELRGCKRARAIVPQMRAATEDDWFEEYGDLTLAVRVVDGFDDAVRHISRFGTRHSEAIVTESYPAAEKFLDTVDAAAVYVNASTRFTDGGEFGFGAEIGISNQKLHARGPIGLRELTTIKYVVRGNGQTR